MATENHHFQERWLYDAVNQIDAGMFSADTFDDPGKREKLRWWMARWERALLASEQAEKDFPELVEQGTDEPPMRVGERVFYKAGNGIETEHDAQNFWTLIKQNPSGVPPRSVAVWEFLYHKGIASMSDVIEGMKVYNDWRADI